MADLSLAITNRVARIERGEDPQLIGRLPSGYAILANQQPEPLTGCCMLLPSPTAPSVNELEPEARARFMTDLVLLGDAVLDATGAERINYLILCNQVTELHGHVVPRFTSEDPELRKRGPFEAYDFPGARRADAEGRDSELLGRLRDALARRSG